MITRRALLIFNFGLAAILAAVGFASIMAAQDFAQATRLTELPNFNVESRQAIEQQQDVEQLRSRALFYFELARELKKARSIDTVRLYSDGRTLAFVVAGLFIFCGFLILLMPEMAKPVATPTL